MYNIMRFLLCVISLVLLVGCGGKQPQKITDRFDFNNATSVTVYAVDPMGQPERCKNLDDIEKAEFGLALFKELIGKVRYKNPRINRTIWKGSRLAIINLSDGTELRLAISCYGSFFKILGEDGIYTFAGSPEAAKRWREEYHEKIVVQQFIPERLGGGKSEK